eukprot:scaffold487_cov178-Ochromonas_danica.AAC.17
MTTRRMMMTWQLKLAIIALILLVYNNAYLNRLPSSEKRWKVLFHTKQQQHHHHHQQQHIHILHCSSSPSPIVPEKDISSSVSSSSSSSSLTNKDERSSIESLVGQEQEEVSPKESMGYDDFVDEDGEVDYALLQNSPSAIDNSIIQAVQRLVRDKDEYKPPELTPLEKFQKICQEIKDSKEKGEEVNMDGGAILRRIFEAHIVREPFDERKVMIKLHKMMKPEDFDGIFKDPVVVVARVSVRQILIAMHEVFRFMTRYVSLTCRLTPIKDHNNMQRHAQNGMEHRNTYGGRERREREN